MGTKPSLNTLLDTFLHEQQSLTAVDLFSQSHASTPSQAKFYKNLIPLETPQAGEQYSFEVDLVG